MEIGSIIRAERKKMKMSQADLANLSDTSKVTVFYVEKGHDASMKVIKKMCDVLNLKLTVVPKY